MIELSNVTKRYAGKTAVDGLSLAIGWGELFAFLGPNGAGKTTTIKLLAGLLSPSEGRIRVGGCDLCTHSREARRLLGYVPDQPYLYDKLTGREFLQFIVEIYGMGGERARRNVAEQIDTFAMSDYIDELAESYSHGMKQRLVFASALVHEPRVLVVDEPMVGLDPKSARLVKDLLREQAQGGTTVFMSTHTLNVAEEIADSIGIVDRGRLLFHGPLDDLRHEQETETSFEKLFLRITERGTPLRRR